MAERSNATVCKTVARMGYPGSNPGPSTKGDWGWSKEKYDIISYMSITYLDIKVKNPQNPQKFTVGHFLVDSGAVYSVMPTSVLKKIGIKSRDKQKFTLANGEVIEKLIGNGLFEYRGRLRGSPVVFGEKGIYLLGAVTLESLGVILDPINRELKPLPMLLMKFLAIEV